MLDGRNVARDIHVKQGWKRTPHSFPVVISSLISQLVKNDLTLVLTVPSQYQSLLCILLTYSPLYLHTDVFLGEEESAVRIYFGGGLQPPFGKQELQ